jgi:UDP-glucose 4-epimerase
VGNGAEISIRDLAAKVKLITGSRSPVQFVPYNQVFDESFEDMPRRVPDIGKISRYIGYRPTVQLDEIIDHVVTFWTDATHERGVVTAPASARFTYGTTAVAASAF